MDRSCKLLDSIGLLGIGFVWSFRCPHCSAAGLVRCSDSSLLPCCCSSGPPSHTTQTSRGISAWPAESVRRYATRCRHEWRHGTQECVRHKGKRPRISKWRSALQTRHERLIPGGLCGIGFVSFFLRCFLERDAGRRPPPPFRIASVSSAFVGHRSEHPENAGVGNCDRRLGRPHFLRTTTFSKDPNGCSKDSIRRHAAVSSASGSRNSGLRESSFRMAFTPRCATTTETRAAAGWRQSFPLLARPDPGPANWLAPNLPRSTVGPTGPASCGSSHTYRGGQRRFRAALRFRRKRQLEGRPGARPCGPKARATRNGTSEPW